MKNRQNYIDSMGMDSDELAEEHISEQAELVANSGCQESLLRVVLLGVEEFIDAAVDNPYLCEAAQLYICRNGDGYQKAAMIENSSISEAALNWSQTGSRLMPTHPPSVLGPPTGQQSILIFH